MNVASVLRKPHKSLGIRRMGTKKTGENQDLMSLLREPRRKARYPSHETKGKNDESNSNIKGKSNCKSKSGMALVVRSVLRKPHKSLGIRRMGRISRNGEPGRGGCGTDHLSVIGAGGRKEKRDKQHSSGDGKRLSGRGAGREQRGCLHVLLTKD